MIRIIAITAKRGLRNNNMQSTARRGVGQECGYQVIIEYRILYATTLIMVYYSNVSSAYVLRVYD